MNDAASQLPAWIQYVSALGPVIVLGGALIAASLAWSAARRDRWWSRTQWAIDQTQRESDGERALGLAVLDVQVDRAPSNDERVIIKAVADALLERFDQYEGENVEYVLDDDSEETSDGEGQQVDGT